MSRVIVVGSVNEDVLVRASIPQPGETVAARDDFALLPGGKGANAACAAARLGAPTSLVGAVGADAAGDRALAALRAGGVSIGRVERAPGVGTGQAIVVVDDAGENAIVIAAGANATIAPTQVAKAIDALAAPGAIVLSNLEIPLPVVTAAARAAAAHGLRFLLDPTPAQPLSAELIPPNALIVPNEHEIATVAGSAQGTAPADALLAAGAGAVIVTRGPAGADLYTAAGVAPRTFPAPRVEVVDTTGAGDAFRGALAAALAAGETL
ncbi:PfkB family carbohydrate kinase, partial [Conexibacter sp. JD483]|uniref:PfkB family carbohydrate kinase n=2 Tax=Conexibacter TaxID=191494 RepID=UPI0028708F31